MGTTRATGRFIAAVTVGLLAGWMVSSVWAAQAAPNDIAPGEERAALAESYGIELPAPAPDRFVTSCW